MLGAKPLSIGCSVLLGLTLWSTPLAAIAQEYVPQSRGTPGRRVGAGTRGGCKTEQNQQVMPLVPDDAFSITVSDSPLFFWYVPSISAAEAEFKLVDAQDNSLHTAQIPLTGAAGIVSYRLPKAIATSVLTLGQDYRWQFSVLCNPQEPSKNPFVEGIVRRIALQPKLAAQIKQAPLADRPAVYAANGIWQEAIATLVEQRCANPTDALLRDRWTRLLQSVKLKNLAKVSLAPACGTSHQQGSGTAPSPGHPH